ncbi:hypothetical protein COCOBI_14-2440 [Coccomyxa sp. Obi]|nr:hypothetical protein COCOBI_14-2440 [Coccomyxa sp. Obi]
MASSTHSTLVGIATSRNTKHHWRFVEYAGLSPAIKLKEPALPCCPAMAASDSVESQVLETMRKTILDLRTQARCDQSISHEERIELLNDALKIKPDSPELLVHRAYCHHLAGDPEAMERDICTAIALESDMTVGKPAVEGRFFRAIARGTMGYIQGALSDMRICLMVFQGNEAAVQDVQQELTFWESFLDSPHDAGRDSPVAEACYAREALGVFLAQGARDEAEDVLWWLLREPYARSWGRKNLRPATAACMERHTFPRGEQAALSVKKTDAPDSPRSATAGPGSSATSSPPESPRSADLAPAQHICVSAPSTCDHKAPVQRSLQRVVSAHESIPTLEPIGQQQNGQVVQGMIITDLAHVLLAVSLWACSRCTPQWVQNKLISASSRIINGKKSAAAIAAVSDFVKKAVST